MRPGFTGVPVPARGCRRTRIRRPAPRAEPAAAVYARSIARRVAGRHRHPAPRRPRPAAARAAPRRPRRSFAAASPLARSHPAAGEVLELVDVPCAGVVAGINLGARDVLAAADDRLRRYLRRDRVIRSGQAGHRRAEPAGAPAGPRRTCDRGRPAQIRRDCRTGGSPAEERGLSAENAGSVARDVQPVNAGPAEPVGLRPPAPAGAVEDALGAHQPGELRRWRQAVADTERVRFDSDRCRERPAAPASVDGGDLHGLQALVADRARDRCAETQGHTGVQQAQHPAGPPRREPRAQRQVGCRGEPIRRAVEIDHRRDLGPALEHPRRHRRQQRSGTGDHHAGAGRDALGLQHRGRSGQAEHARRRPSGKGQDALDGAGRDQQCRRLHRMGRIGPDRIQAKAVLLGYRRPHAPAERGPHAGAVELTSQAVAGASVRVRVAGAGPGRQERVGGLSVDLSAGGGRFVDEQHRWAGRRHRGADAGRPRPEHRHVDPLRRCFGRHAIPTGASRSTRMPSSAGVRHAWRTTPSTRIRHSWQTPIMQ